MWSSMHVFRARNHGCWPSTVYESSLRHSLTFASRSPPLLILIGSMRNPIVQALQTWPVFMARDRRTCLAETGRTVDCKPRRHDTIALRSRFQASIPIMPARVGSMTLDSETGRACTEHQRMPQRPGSSGVRRTMVHGVFARRSGEMCPRDGQLR